MPEPARAESMFDEVPTEDAEVGTAAAADGGDVYFSADVETDGPIPGPYSMLSFALVWAGSYDGQRFHRPSGASAAGAQRSFYAELRPISSDFDPETLAATGLDRARLCSEGQDPVAAMTDAAAWVRHVAGPARPVLVAYPLSLDWTWLYWYFVRFSQIGSPFEHSSCFDIKTAFAVKAKLPVAWAGQHHLLSGLRSTRAHAHNALDDALAQAEVFAKVFEWDSSSS